jgi:hypothetical protein
MLERWLAVRAHLLPAIERMNGTHTETDVFLGICAGHYRLWVSPSGASALVTEFIQYPRMKVLSVLLAGGKYEEIEALGPAISEFAKAQGCARIIAGGRKGWGAVIKDATFHSLNVYRDL